MKLKTDENKQSEELKPDELVTLAEVCEQIRLSDPDPTENNKKELQSIKLKSGKGREGRVYLGRLDKIKKSDGRKRFKRREIEKLLGDIFVSNRKRKR